MSYILDNVGGYYYGDSRLLLKFFKKKVILKSISVKILTLSELLHVLDDWHGIILHKNFFWKYYDYFN